MTDGGSTGNAGGEAIVVGYTTGDTGRAALDAAVAEARRREARLAVVHSMVGGPDTEREIKEMTEHRDALEDLERDLAAGGFEVQARLHVRGLSPAEDLAETVREENASLLVIGYRRRSRTSKYLLGSDAQQIILESPCPVLAVGTDIV
jgi:nucleotide-binding universal stress UspA family protein